MPQPRRGHVLRLACLLALIWIATPAKAAAPDADGVAFFESKVRPILVERCYSCHSAQAENVRGGLVLDSKPGWQKGGDIGPAIEPGNPDDSLFVQAIRWDDDTLKMPPKGKLPEAEIAALVEWVRLGAPDPRTEAPAVVAAKPGRVIDLAKERQHWAYQALRVAEPPQVRDAAWPQTPIDRFILAPLEAKGLAPNPPVDRVKLIRRMSFDVTGLPPTPEEIDAFVNDREPGAVDRLIDRLLASPHYGERWARHWLDLARFGESHGFEHDYDRPSAYHYRDFVVEALNRDLPYTEFVRWQLAGDEIAPDDPLALKATGFLAAGVHSTQITASQAEKERYDELDDMANVTGTAFLGLTVGCARCHDHKFDPIPTADYYRMVATFTTTVRSEVDLDLDPESFKQAKATFDREHEPYAAALAAFERDQLPARLATWEAGRSADPDDFPWLVLDLKESKSAGGATFTRQPDGSVLATGKSPDHETYTFTAEVDAAGITAIRLEALTDPSLVKGGPGRASNGNFALTDLKVTARPKAGGDAVPVQLKDPRATFEQAGLPVAAAIDDDGTSAWAVDPQFGRDHAAAFATAEPFGFEGGTVLTFTLRFTNNLKHAIGRPRLAISRAGGAVALDAPAFPQAVAAALETPRDRRTPEQAQAVLAWYRTLDPEWRKLKEAEQAHAARAPKPSVVKALISTEGLPAVRLHTQGPDFYDKTYLLRRGDLTQKVSETEAGFLQALVADPKDEARWRTPPPAGWRTSYRRTALANWITDVDRGAGPLLARVIVNRLWQHHLGRGLVATPSDFGTQGDRPTHPELLDWLAGHLIAEGWHLKAIHKLILQSAVYQQSSRIDESKARVDIGNTLYWRQNRQRLEAEVIRDAMLAVSGQLDDHLFGPGTLDPSSRRRSLYFTVKRSRLVPMMSLFDAPDALVAIGQRSSTTVAPQALLLLNGPEVRSWAGALAQRVAPGPGGSRDDAIGRAYRLTLGRGPDAAEQADARAFLDQQAGLHRADGQSDPEVRALADFCHVLFCTNEFVFVE